MTDYDAFRLISRDTAARLLLGLTIFALCILHGCAMLIDEQSAPADWPTLTVREHRVGITELRAHCGTGPLLLSLGLPSQCARIHFEQRTCDVYLIYDADELAREHELGHCAGKDHPGESNLRDAWAAYRRAK